MRHGFSSCNPGFAKNLNVAILAYRQLKSILLATQGYSYGTAQMQLDTHTRVTG